MSAFQWVETIGTIFTVAVGIGLLAWFRALNILVQAQLHPNGGGSLMDKANLIVAVKEALAELRALVESNHREGQASLIGLRDQDGDLAARIDHLDDVAREFGERLGPRLAIQDDLVRRLGIIEGRIERAEKELFGDDR